MKLVNKKIYIKNMQKKTLQIIVKSASDAAFPRPQKNRGSIRMYIDATLIIIRDSACSVRGRFGQ